MKRIFPIFLLFISVCATAQVENGIPKKPSLSEGLIHDFTKTLSPEQEVFLENKLQAYDKTTSNQVAVVIISSTNGNSIEDAALGILRSWGVGGQAEKDNGIVLLVAKDDKKIRIEVGYGLEGVITDYTSSSIIENSIVPNFKAGNFYRGIDEAIDKIIEAAEGRYQAPKGYGKKKGLKTWQIFLLVFGIWILLGIFSGGKKGGGGYVSRRGWMGPTIGGGGWSGGGGGGGFGGFGGGGGGGGGSSGSW